MEDILKASADLEEENKNTLGLKKVCRWEDIPESISDFPCSIRYAEEGITKVGAGFGKTAHRRFYVEVLMRRGHVPDTMATLIPMIEGFEDLYASDLSLGGTCDQLEFLEPFWRFGEREYPEASGQKHLILLFHFEAKETASITVSA